MARSKKRKDVDRVEEPGQLLKKTKVSTTPLPEGVYHYQNIDEVPWDVQKYHVLSQFCLLALTTLTDTGTKATRSSLNMTKGSG